MFDFYTYAGQSRACTQVISWCRQAAERLAELGERRDGATGWRVHLDRWQAAFTELETEARRILGHRQFGIYNPLAAAYLLARANQLFASFNEFIQAVPAALTPERPATRPIKRPKEDPPPMEETGRVPIGGHKLPPLPYAYDALEPHIDAQTMRLHHQRHHQSYVDGLNKAEQKMAEARETGDFDLIKHWEREAAFHGAGHYLHTIFWAIMSPEGGGEPSGPLADQIRQDFGSFAKFKQHFSQAAEKVEAVGWAILVWAPRAHRLEILTAEKHQNLSQWDVIPLLPLDVWEHAYYLKHQNERKKYIDAWWNVVNWPEVSQRFDEARKLKWQPF